MAGQNTKVKCASCGCWAAKGEECRQCGEVAADCASPLRAASVSQLSHGPFLHRAAIHNHSFRDAAPERRHTKVKCGRCGCWMPAGDESAECRHCGRRAGDAEASDGPGVAARVQRHRFREAAPEQPHTKVKCGSCGCWAPAAEGGGGCRHCGWCPGDTEDMAGDGPGVAARVQRHQFRPDAPPARPRTKVKCARCGCWKGVDETARCAVCDRHAAGGGGRRGTTAGAGAAAVQRHRFRDVGAAPPPDRPLKVKCTGCGCWVRPDAGCRVCKRPAAGSSATTA